MQTWAGIVRVSHMGARVAGAPNVHTDREQEEAIRSATPQGDRLEVLAPELDVSGGLPLEQRPSLRVAVEGVESARYAGIIVAYQSRLFRNVEEEEAVWRRVEAAGGEVLLALDGLDTRTVSGRMVRRIKSAINTAEREEHAERFDRLRRWATEAGVWQRRQTPLGYSKDPETRRLVPNDGLGQVQRAFRAFLAGTPVTQIAESLRMTPSGVRYLLRNRVYLGELRVGDYLNPGAHAPIIDLDTFEAVQHRFASGIRPARKHRGPALLAGLVRCQSCGHVMTRGSSKGGSAYGCPGHHSGQRCPKPAAVMESRVDEYVVSIAHQELERLQITTTADGGVEDARRQLAEAERALDAYLDAISPEDVGPEAFSRAARKKRAAVDEARDSMRGAIARTPSVSTVGDPSEVWTDLQAPERNTLLRGLFAAVIVRPAGRGKKLPMSERVRVLQYGSPLHVPTRRGETAAGIVPLPFPDHDDVGVLGIPLVEDRLQNEGGVS